MSQDFRSTVFRYIVANAWNRLVLAGEFLVTPSTVGRWASGSAVPPTEIQLEILEWIASETAR